jgi:ATP-dependent DNA ligase
MMFSDRLLGKSLLPESNCALVFAKARELGLEGIVSKRLGSRYRSGPSRNWLKCLNPDFQRR